MRLKLLGSRRWVNASGPTSRRRCWRSIGPMCRDGEIYMDCQQVNLFGEPVLKPLRSYQGGSRASRIALQESAKRLVTSVISGRKCGELLARLSPDGSWLKTYQGYYQVKMDGSLQEFSEILPRWGLMSDGELRALPQLEPCIDESEWRLLPTPTASDYKGGVLAEEQQEANEQLEGTYLHLLRYTNAQYLSESGFLRKFNGVPDRVDRTKCLGNAVVPQAFYPFFKAIYDIEHGGEP